MSKKWIALVVACIALALSGAHASADGGPPTFVSTCGLLDAPGATYLLTANISLISPDNCFTIAADGITLDGNFFTITGAGGATGVVLENRTGVTVQNITATGFNEGIALVGSSGNTLSDNTFSNNVRGIYLVNFNNNKRLRQ